MSWTQPCCDECWTKREAGRVANRLKDDWRDTERCAFCGQDTRSGIYVRENPAVVPFPATD